METTKWLLRILNYFSKNNQIEEFFNKRPKQTRNEFMAEVFNNGYGVSYGSIVYDGLLQLLPKGINNINMSLNDMLIKDYDMDDEEVGDILISYFKNHHIPFPSSKEQLDFYKEKGEEVTVERLIQFLERFAKNA